MSQFLSALILAVYPATLLYRVVPYKDKGVILLLVFIALAFVPLRRLINSYSSNTLYTILLAVAAIALIITSSFHIPGIDLPFDLPKEIVEYAKNDTVYFVTLAVPLVLFFFFG
jgi:hypothetical protein